MRYSETKDQANEYFRLVLTQIGKHDVPLNPVNYAVWYELVSGRNPDLKDAIANLISKSKQLTPELLQELFDRFVSENHVVKPELILRDIRNLLKELSSSISDKETEISGHGNALKQLADKVQDSVDSADVSGVVEEILMETKKIISVGDNLKSRMAEADEEVGLLRRELSEEKQKSLTDPLTGICNRLAFEEAMINEIKKAEQTGQSLCLLLSDIDHFKKVNDTFGHLVGDMVLRLSAELMTGFIKGRDIVARIGGEEFAIILPDTPMEGAATVAEKIRADFQTKVWKRRDTKESIGAITFSFGLARLRPSEHWEDLFNRADAALYYSKKKGRNQVTREEEVQGK